MMKGWLTGIVRAGLDQSTYGDLPPLVPVNVLGAYSIVDQGNPCEISPARIRSRITKMAETWKANGDLLLIDLESLDDPDSPGENRIRGRTSQGCLREPEHWTEKHLEAALDDARLQVQRTADVFAEVVEVVRESIPEMKLAFWGFPSIGSRDTYAAFANRVGRCVAHDAEPEQWRYLCYLWQAEHMQLCAEKIGPLVDWYAPGVYVDIWHGRFAHNPQLPWLADDVTGKPTPLHAAVQTELDAWSLTTAIGLTLARSAFPSKPWLPFISPQWWQDGGQSWSHGYGLELVSPEFMERMLNTVKGLGTDGLVLWCQPEKMEDPEPYYESDTFRAARRWAACQHCMEL